MTIEITPYLCIINLGIWRFFLFQQLSIKITSQSMLKRFTVFILCIISLSLMFAQQPAKLGIFESKVQGGCSLPNQW